MSIYCGIAQTARNIKNIYIGVDGRARKITKGYLGDRNGLARCFYSQDSEEELYTAFIPVNSARKTIDERNLFFGGFPSAYFTIIAELGEGWYNTPLLKKPGLYNIDYENFIDGYEILELGIYSEKNNAGTIIHCTVCVQIKGNCLKFGQGLEVNIDNRFTIDFNEKIMYDYSSNTTTYLCDLIEDSNLSQELVGYFNNLETNTFILTTFRFKNITFPPVFSDATWSQIVIACQTNKVPNTWNVGDSKNMLIEDTEYPVQIIGKAHDHYTSSTNPAPLTLQFKKCVISSQYIAIYNGREEYYLDSMLHNSVMGHFMLKMPIEVRKGIKPVDKLCHESWMERPTLNGDEVIPNYTPVNNVSCYLFDLALAEIYDYSNSVGPSIDGVQYEFFKTETGTKLMDKFDNLESSFWTRTPSYRSAYVFVVTGEGISSSKHTHESAEASPAFCFGEVVPSTVISFNLHSLGEKKQYTQYAYEGMSVQEWLESEFNTFIGSGYSIGSTGYVSVGTDALVFNGEWGDMVHKDLLITQGQNIYINVPGNPA